jgi:ribonuclease HII
MPRSTPIDLPKQPDLSLETPLWASGLTLVAGLDEAGRGAWAGPVFAAVVVLPTANGIAQHMNGVRDSKQMTARQRTLWAERIKSNVHAWGIGQAEAGEIDALGIVPATRLAMQRALLACDCAPQHLLVDALRLPEVELPQSALIKGDARSLSIAAASVLAKTARDAWMVGLDGHFPHYGFSAHKGYGTARHRTALTELGPCSVHRMSFAPIRSL